MGENNIKLLEEKGYSNLVKFLLDKDGNETVRYFVKKNSEVPSKYTGLSAAKLCGFLGAMSTQKEDTSEVKTYNKEARTVKELIFSKEYLVLFVLAIIILGSTLYCEIATFSLASEKQVSQNSILNQTGDIVYWYTNLTKLEVGLNYMDLNSQIGYSNNFTRVKILSRSLDLHFVNERLRSLSIATYSLPSILNGTTYSVTAFEMTMKIIANAYIINKFNSTDPFLEKLTIVSERNIMNVMNYQALFEYQQQFQASTQLINNDFQTFSLILLIIISCGLIILYLLLIRG
jgi:hypothetical protein